MPKKVVSDEVKTFIVKSLAVYESLSEVSKSIKEKFDLILKPQTIQHYDPTKIAGDDLDKDLKDLFFATRKQFDEQEILPLSKKLVRIKKLGKYVEAFENFENFTAAAAVLEQIAKEEGGLYTNKQRIEHKITDVGNLSDEQIEQRRTELLKRVKQS